MRSTCWSVDCCAGCRTRNWSGREGNQFAYPFRWFYSVMEAVDYFRDAALHDQVPPDPRLADAIEAIRGSSSSGRHLVAGADRHPGRVWFEVDVPPGEPSKWLTFYGTRCWTWWDAAQA